MARKAVIKTNMLTPEQLNRKKEFLFSDLAFAIGVDERNLELPYDGRTDFKDIFKKELEKYGLIIKEVDSLKKLDGKTGFIHKDYSNFDQCKLIISKKDAKICIFFDIS